MLNKFYDFAIRSLKDKRGATAVEYTMIAALIAGAIITVIGGLGTQLNTALTRLSAAI